MDVRIINSILKSTVKIFTEAVNMKIEFEKPQIAKELAKGYDLVTLVGFNGSLSGNLVYAFDTQVALSVVQKMMGMPYNQLDELAMSAIGELANMISGNIATNMEQIGKPIDITPPSVILGKEIRVNVDGVILKIITKYEDKTFEVDMVLRESVKSRKKSRTPSKSFGTSTSCTSSGLRLSPTPSWVARSVISWINTPLKTACYSSSFSSSASPPGYTKGSWDC